MRISLAASILAITCAFALPLDARAQQVPRAGFDFTLVDAPYDVAEGLRGPSMRQSLDLSIATYEVGHQSVQRWFGKRRRLGRSAIALLDIATTLEVALPLTSVWVHEEFHRTIMGRRVVRPHGRRQCAR